MNINKTIVPKISAAISQRSSPGAVTATLGCLNTVAASAFTAVISPTGSYVNSPIPTSSAYSTAALL